MGDDIIAMMEEEYQCNYHTQYNTSAEPPPRTYITDRPYVSEIKFFNGFKLQAPDIGYEIQIVISDPDGIVRTEQGIMRSIKDQRNFFIKTGGAISAIDYANKLEDLAIQIREYVMELTK